MPNTKYRIDAILFSAENQNKILFLLLNAKYRKPQDDLQY